MNLHEWDEFRDSILAAARDAGLDERFVEKDYWVTAILRIVVEQMPGRTIFKGGTSLSKGWGLIERFSEDIDLFVDADAFDPPLGKNPLDRELKRLRDRIADHPGLTYLKDESVTIGGLGRADNFQYDALFGDLPGLRPVVRLEPGRQSGKQPTEERQLNSIVAEFLRNNGRGDVAEDLEPFPMTLLHFRRTYVEKLFTVHGKVERLKQDGVRLGRDARHYADLHALVSTEPVQTMLHSDEYDQIKQDYDQLSSQYYPNSHRPPPQLSFADSDALFPEDRLREQIEEDYDRECRLLFAERPYPSFEEVVEAHRRIRDIL